MTEMDRNEQLLTDTLEPGSYFFLPILTDSNRESLTVGDSRQIGGRRSLAIAMTLRHALGRPAFDDCGDLPQQ
jgi:hypothetical protein